jgi:hypothetical protein
MQATSLRDIQAALQKKSGFEIINHSESPLQLRISGRQRQDRMNMNVANWHLVMLNLLEREEEAPWTADFSKHHITRGQKGQKQIVFYWRLIFQVKEGSITEHYGDIVRTILSASHTSRGEITEFPLPGAGKDRNANGGIGKGRGATGAR